MEQYGKTFRHSFLILSLSLILSGCGGGNPLCGIPGVGCGGGSGGIELPTF